MFRHFAHILNYGMKKTYIYCCILFFSLFVQRLSAQVDISNCPVVKINSGNPAYPFPQFLEYAKGKTLAKNNAEGVTHADMEKAMREGYEIMTHRCRMEGYSYCGVPYITYNRKTIPQAGAEFCSEGDGYILLASAIFADQATFNGLWMWIHDNRFSDVIKYQDGNYIRKGADAGPNMAGWNCEGSAVLNDGSTHSATDGDVDIAMALLIAYKQWGEFMYQNGTLVKDAKGNSISYKEAAKGVIKALVDTIPQWDKGSGKISGYLCGDIGVDGYVKRGNSWGEQTSWRFTQTTFPWATTTPNLYSIYGGNYVDYNAPSYFNEFAEWLQNGDGSGTAWEINQFKRAEVASDWLTGMAYQQGLIASIGQASISTAGVPTFSVYSDGEDFRFAWRNLLNYLWHGNPTTGWDPITHQPTASGNTFNYDMSVRHAKHLKSPSIGGVQKCKAMGASPDPGQPKWWGVCQIPQQWGPTGETETSWYGTNYSVGTGTIAAVASEDLELIGDLYRQCEIMWDDAGTEASACTPTQRYIGSTPKYFHDWFRLLGMLTCSGNLQAPRNMKPIANMKVYLSVDKTYAYKGDNLTYQVNYRNYGSLDAQGVTVTTTLDNNYTFVSATKGGTLSGNKITWNIGTVKGFKSGGLSATMDSMTFVVTVKDTLTPRICLQSIVTATNSPSWTSNEYPNHATYTMERNCVDILGTRMLQIKKSASRTKMNPGDIVKVTLDFKNLSSSNGNLYGGRSNVILSYGNFLQGTGATNFYQFSRFWHDGAEAYINMHNYRLSYFMYDASAMGLYDATTNKTGWSFYVDNANDVTKYGLNPASGPIEYLYKKIPAGSDSYGKWNQRLTVRYGDVLTAPATHIYDKLDHCDLIHKGVQGPALIRTNLAANPTADMSTRVIDDWSYSAALQSKTNDGQADIFTPISPSWQDVNNLGVPVTNFARHVCSPASVANFSRVLVEEFDGYTWRRVLGTGPLSGREAYNVTIIDTIPKQLKWNGFSDSLALNVQATYTAAATGASYTGIVKWVVPEMLVGENGNLVYSCIAKDLGCPTAPDTYYNNIAWISSTTDSPDSSKLAMMTSCTALPPVIDPQTSLFKTANVKTAKTGDVVSYKLKYINNLGTTVNADCSSMTKWQTMGSGVMPVGSASGIKLNVTNSFFGPLKAYGVNGSVTATLSNLNNGNSAYFVLRYVSGTPGTASFDGVYVKVIVNPYGSNTLGLEIYDGTTLIDKFGDSYGTQISYPGSGDLNVRISIIGSSLYIYLNDDANGWTTVTKSYTNITKTLHAGSVGIYIPGNGNSMSLTKFVSSFDYAFDITLYDRLAAELTNITSISNSGVWDQTKKTITWPIVAGPIKANDSLVYTFKAQVSSCNNFITNLGLATVYGLDTLKVLNTIACGSAPLCSPPTSVTLVASPTGAVCDGSTVTLTATAAPTGTWTYAFKKATTQVQTSTTLTTYNANTTGNYTVNVYNTLDSASCNMSSAIATVTINPLPTIVPVASPTKICAGALSTISVSGGTSYSWDNSIGTAASKAVSPTITTTYKVTGTDANGCVNTASVILTVNSLPTIVATATPTVVCPGASSSLVATGGTSYLWSSLGSGTPKTVSPTGTTTYTVTGTDANSCSNTTSVAVAVTPLPTVTLTASPTSICKGSTSTLTAAGATTYTWSNTLLSGTTNTVSPTTATTYTVTGTSSGCTATASATVSIYASPTITISAAPTLVCAGYSTVLKGNGGTSYSWSNSLGNGTSVTATPTTGTTYFVTGTDANGCTGTASTPISYTIPPPPTTEPDQSITLGSAIPTLTASGTLIKWYNASGTTLLATGTSYTPPSSIVDATVSGTYPFKVTNTVNDCESAQLTETITVSGCSVIAPTVNMTSQTKCQGTAFTAITATGTSIKWYGSDQSTLLGTGVSYTPTGAGEIYVSQTNICEGPKTKITITVNPLPTITASASATPICKGKTSILTATGATSYLWSNASNLASQTVTPTASTTYSVTGTDANSCSNTASVSVTVNSLPSITAGASPGNVCAGNTTSLTATGGTSYLWSGTLGATATVVASPSANATYSVTGIDANGCAGTANVSITYTTPVLPTVGVYPSVTIGAAIPTLTATGTVIKWYNDAKTASLGAGTSFTPTISTNGNAVFVFYVTNTINNCESDFVKDSIIVSGCTTTAPTVTNPTISTCQGLPFTAFAATGTNIKWYSSDQTSSVGTGASFTPTAPGGDYYVSQTIICEGPKTKVTATVNALPTITASAVPATICAGSSSIISALGGSSYAWSNMSILASQTVSPAVTTSYMVIGTDINGCTNTASATVTVTPLPTITITPSAPKICYGSSTSLTASGATSYVWNNILPATAVVTVSPLATQTYSVTGTSSGCSSSANVTVTVYPLNQTVISATNPTICLGDNSTITASGSGSYSWSSGATTPAITVSPSATKTYSVTGIDANACSTTASTIVTVNPLPTITATVANASVCLGNATTISASGGLSFTWSNYLGNSSSVSITPTATTSYSVTGTNAFGCINSASVTVTSLALPSVTLTGGGSYCSTMPAVTVNVTGGLANYKVTYTTNGASPYTMTSVTGSSALPITADGDYAVSLVEDANGCNAATYPAKVSVTKNGSATYTISGGATYCQGLARNPVSINITSMDGPWQLIYNDGTSDHTQTIAVGALPFEITNPDKGIYTVKQITNKDNCVALGDATKSTTVTINDTTIASFTGIPATLCDNGKPITLTYSPTLGTRESAVISSPSGAVSGNQFFPSQAGGAGTKTIKITYTNAANCVSVNTASIQVLTSPVASITGSPSYSVCYGIDQIIDASHTTTAAPYSFGWYLSNTLLTADNVEDPTFKAGTPVGTYPLQYIVTDGNDCKDTADISIEVKNKTKPKWLTTLPELCSNNASIDLKDFVTPYDATNGSFTIDGVAATSSIIDPKVVSATAHSIVYTYTMGSCSDSEDTILTIKTAPAISLGTYQTEFCDSASSYTFTSLSPSTGGVLSGTGVSGLSFDPKLATTKNAPFDLTYKVTQNGCSDSKPVPVTVWSAPVVSFNLPSSACAKDMGINMSSLVTPAGGTYSVAEGVAGTYFYPKAVTSFGSAINISYTVTAHGCPSKVNKTIIVTKTAVPTVTDASAIVPVTTVPPISANGSNLKLYDSTYSIINAAWSGSYADASKTSAGTYNYWATQTVNGCESDSVPVKLTITNCTAATPGGVGSSICFGDAPGSITATGLSQSGMIYRWFQKNTFTGDQGASLTMASALAVEKYSYNVKIYDTVNACYGAASQPIVYEVKALPAILFTPDTVMCENSKIQDLTANVVQKASTFWLNGTQIPNFNPSGKVGINKIEVRYTDPSTSCSNALFDTIRVKALPVLAFPLQSTACSNGSVISFNATPVGGTYFGGPLESDGKSVNPKNLALNSTTTYNYRFTDNKGCSDTVSTPITAYDSTKVTIILPGNKNSLCQNAAAISLSSNVVGGSFTINGILNSGTFNPTTPGIYSIIYSYTNANNCHSSDRTSLTVNALPTISNAIPASNLSACSNGGPISLTGTPSGLIFSGTAVSSSLAGYTFNPKTAGAGTFTIGYSYTDANSCSNSASLSISVQDIQPPVVADQSLFSFNNPKIITATGSNLKWYGKKGDKSDFLLSAQQLTNADLKAKNYTDNLDIAGVYPFYVTQTVGKCESDVAKINVTIKNCSAQAPLISSLAPWSCFASAFTTISVTSHVNGTIAHWYDANKKLIATGDSFTPSASNLANATGSSFLYVADSLTSEGCQSSLTPITYTVKVVNKPTVSNPGNICETDIAGKKITATGDGGTFLWTYNAQTFTGATLLLTSAGITAGKASPYSLSVIQQKNGCNSDPVAVAVNVSIRPTKPVISPAYFEKCSDIDVFSDITATANGSVSWYNDPLLKSNVVASKILPASALDKSVGIHYYYAVNSDGSCFSDTATASYNVKLPPSTPTGKDVYKCSTSSVVPSLSVAVQAGASAIWFTDPLLSTGKFEGLTYQPVLHDTILYAIAYMNGCPSIVAKKMQLKTFTAPLPVISTTKDSLCKGESTILKATGTDVKWYDASKRFIQTSSQLDYIWSAIGPHYFFASARKSAPDLTSCYSDYAMAPVIIDKPVPGSLTIDPISICANDTLRTFISHYSGSGALIWQTSAAVNVYTGVNYKPKKSDVSIGMPNVFTATILEKGCYGPANDAIYTIHNSVPMPIIAQSPVPFCIGSSSTLDISTNVENPFWLNSANKSVLIDSIIAKANNPGSFVIKAYQNDDLCSSDTTSFTVNSYKTPSPIIEGDDSVCENSIGVIYNIRPQNQDVSGSYQWAITRNIVSYSTDNAKQFRRAVDWMIPGIDTITVTETSENGCSASDSIAVKVAPAPSALFTSENSGQEGSVLFFNQSEQSPIIFGSSSENIPFHSLWNFGRPNDSFVEIDSIGSYDAPISQIYDYGYWKVKIKTFNDFGCSDSSEKEIFVDISTGLFVPNSFVPESNSEGLRLFKPVGFNLESYKISIFDTWGNLIWYSDRLINGSPADGWDGKANGVILKCDSYIWKIEASFKNDKHWKGNKQSSGKYSKFGNVLLLR